MTRPGFAGPATGTATGLTTKELAGQLRVDCDPGLRDGSAARVPLLIGGTHDEMRGGDDPRGTGRRSLTPATRTVPGLPPWPEFGSAGTVIGLSTRGIAPTPYAEDHRCDFWAGRPR